MRHMLNRSGRWSSGHSIALSRAADRISMIRLSLISLLFATGAWAQSSDQLQGLMNGIVDRHKEICSAVMENPQLFVGRLAASAPEESYGVRTSPDGKLFRITVSSDLGQYTTTYSRYMLDNSGHEDCVTFFQNSNAIPNGTAAADAFQQVTENLLGSDNVNGGQIAQLFPDASGQSDRLDEFSESFEFVMKGVLEDSSLITISQVSGGYVTIASGRQMK